MAKDDYSVIVFKILSQLNDTPFSEGHSTNPISTIKHELIHWDDAQNYIKEFGEITEKNIEKYNDYRQSISLKMLDSANIYEYNIYKFGQYAENSYMGFNFDEAYTEYRVAKI